MNLMKKNIMFTNGGYNRIDYKYLDKLYYT